MIRWRFDKQNCSMFVKGQSGNPFGRPKEGREVQLLARECTEAAIGVLEEIMICGTSETCRLMAANALLDRGWGRPKQAVELSGAEGGPLQIEDVRAENFAILAAIADRIAGAAAARGTGGGPRQLTNGRAEDVPMAMAELVGED
jgi:hypothetical protein